MTDDTCSATKNNGEPCEYTAKYPDGKCGIHSEHNDRTPEGGRPSKLDDAWDDAMEAASKGLTKAGIARYCGIDEATLHRWLNRHDEFRKSLRRERAKAEISYVADPDDPNHAQFLLERSFGYTKEQEVELSGAVDTGGLDAEDKELLNDLLDRDPQ